MKIVKLSIFALSLGLLAACKGNGGTYNGKDSVAPAKEEDYSHANSMGAGPDTAKKPVNSSGTGTAGHVSGDTAKGMQTDVSGGSSGTTGTNK